MRSSKDRKWVIVCVLSAVVALAGTILIWKVFFKSEPIRHIILISIDTCRADHLSCYGYPQKTTPNIDQFAQEGILFKNVMTPLPMTLPAHISMLTGQNPLYHNVHNNTNRLGQSNLTLQEILQSNDFVTGAILSSFVLDSQFGLNQGFDSYNDRFEKSVHGVDGNERHGEEASRVAIKWIEENRDEKFFLFLHYYDPHHVYEPPEPFASRFHDSPYAGEIAFTDHCIGQVIQKLKELDLYDSTLIIIAGDHGEMLGEHGEVTHQYFIYQGAIRVPLILKLPEQQKAKKIKDCVGLVDIVPTICSLLDIKPQPQMQGRNLVDYFVKARKAPPKTGTFTVKALRPQNTRPTHC